MERSKKRHMLVFGSTLAALALVGTFMFQKASSDSVDSSAMEKTLNCTYEVHQHSPSCYSPDGDLICGYADWVVHMHNKDCYDSDGNLVCKLKEHPAHVHKYSCYGTEATGSAVSGNAVSIEPFSAPVDTSTVEVVSRPSGNSITDEQIEEMKKEIVKNREKILDESEVDDDDEDDKTAKSTAKPTAKTSTKPAATEIPKPLESTAPKATETPKVTIKPTETPKATAKPETTDKDGKHVHTDDCYVTFRVLDCTEDKEDKNHVHDDECYVIVKILMCADSKTTEDPNSTAVPSKNGEHVHTDDCFLSIRVLTCGKENDKNHTHTDECYKTIRVTACEERVPVCGEWELHTHDDSCFKDGKWVCGKLEVKEHIHGKECFDLTSSTSKKKPEKDNKKSKRQTKTITKTNSDGKGDGKNNYEVVKTGEGDTPLFIVIGAAIIAGFAYFLVGTKKGRKLLDKNKKE